MVRGKAGKPFRKIRKKRNRYHYWEGWNPYQFRWFYPNSPSQVGKYLQIRTSKGWRKAE